MSEDTLPKRAGRPRGSRNRTEAQKAIDKAQREARKAAKKVAWKTARAIAKADGLRIPAPARRDFSATHVPMCPHCQHPLGSLYTVADVRDELEGHVVLDNIPAVYKHESPTRLAAHLLRGLSMLYGVPPAMFRSAFLKELDVVVRHLHPNFRSSAARACLEGRLTKVAPFVEVRPGVRDRLNRVLEVLDLLQSMAVLKKSDQMREVHAKASAHAKPVSPDTVDQQDSSDNDLPQGEGPPWLCRVSVSSSCAFCRCEGLSADVSECPWCGSSVHLSPTVNADRLRLYRDAGKIVKSAHSVDDSHAGQFWCLVCAWSGPLGENERERCPRCLQKNGDDFLEANLRWTQTRRLAEAQEKRAAEVAAAAKPAPTDTSEPVEDPNPAADPKEEVVSETT